jgi:hypothetical protein
MFDKWVYPHLEKKLSRVGKDEEKEMENHEGVNEDMLKRIMDEH